MYNMIERKLRNHATRKYPKNFNHKEVSTLYEDTFDEKYNAKGELITAEEQVQIANDDVEKNAGSTKLAKEETVEKIKKVENDDRPSLKVEEEKVEKEEPVKEEATASTIEEAVNVVEEPKEEEVEVKTEETQEQSLVDDDMEDWMK
jgi:hypothetical protein